jgi:hypothetical protein
MTDSGVQDLIKQIVKGDTVVRVEPNYRYRSFRNGLYQMEVDLTRETDLSWNDPARLNGRFIPYSSPECPPDVAVETFFDTDFDPEWLTMPVESIDTAYLDALLATQNIMLSHYMQRPQEVIDAT